MITYYILGSVALVLNILGRVLILRRDQQLSDGWHRAIKFLPGAELLYLMFRWEKARLGCVVCGVSVIGSLPVAHHFLVTYSAGEFARLLAPVGLTTDKTGAATRDPAQLKKLAEHKEKTLTEVNQYLAQWYQTLTTRQAQLSTANPEETLDYNRAAAAYQNLMRVWKSERQATDTLKAELSKT